MCDISFYFINYVFRNQSVQQQFESKYQFACVTKPAYINKNDVGFA